MGVLILFFEECVCVGEKKKQKKIAEKGKWKERKEGRKRKKERKKKKKKKKKREKIAILLWKAGVGDMRNKIMSAVREKKK